MSGQKLNAEICLEVKSCHVGNIFMRTPTSLVITILSVISSRMVYAWQDVEQRYRFQDKGSDKVDEEKDRTAPFVGSFDDRYGISHCPFRKK